MSRWSSSNYEGPKENGWPQGKGKYTFPNGTIYEGFFDKGEFHGDGVLIYPKKVNNPKLQITYNISLGPLRCQMGKRKNDRRKILLL